MTYRTLKAGFRVKEIPIVFHERRAGDSKMDARIAAEAVWKVPALRRRLRHRKLPARWLTSLYFLKQRPRTETEPRWQERSPT